ncbi:MAG: hypothetical protein DBX55_04160 [Verrucomicrobia bacterium]|nr:MAG: hypothetical protein DBX55_04160 [Verrucomicrobiota bacterium]
MPARKKRDAKTAAQFPKLTLPNSAAGRATFRSPLISAEAGPPSIRTAQIATQKKLIKKTDGEIFTPAARLIWNQA